MPRLPGLYLHPHPQLRSWLQRAEERFGRTDSMSTCAGTAEGGELAPVVPQPTHIDVHIHQESALAKLLQATGFQLRSWAQPKGTASQAPGSSRLLVASWVTQIMLGVLSGVLGGFLYIFEPSYLVGSGAAIWTAAVAVLAGTAAFLREKRGGVCWGFLRTLLALTAFSTAVAAIKIGADGSYWNHFYNGAYVCDTSSRRSWPTPPPSTLSPEEARRQHLCVSYVDMLRALFTGLKAMLLSVWVLLLVASLAPLATLASPCLHCCRRLLPEELLEFMETL
ncbi:transmembrane protein 176A-like isoform X2 [Elephas maximus indicus]|uniref:transmembrane protein 176A-like isoform X2 n=1 Tax=Elephas maximus indicus TaxID=99487 RepID=UPI002115F348|nr:transmembrane protein 176A-like isoform X2 [Elephas maximus indicus]